MKTLQKLYITERLERLKAVGARSWQELAADLDVTYQSLYLIKAGKMGVSPKFERRLRGAEARAGVPPTPPANVLHDVAARYGMKSQTLEVFEIFVRALPSLPPEVQAAWAYREMFQELRQRYRKAPVAEQNLIESALGIVFARHHSELMKWLNEK